MSVPQGLVLRFMPEEELADSWHEETRSRVQCPVCRHDYIHLREPLLIDSEDIGKAWIGRGDAIKVPFWGECEHKFVLCFGFHKGKITAYWEAAS